MSTVFLLRARVFSPDNSRDALSVAASKPPMIFCSGLASPEGPVSLSDRSWLCVEGGESRGCITRISADGSSRRIVAVTGRPNGLAVDRHDRIWAAESQTPSLLRVSLLGKVETIATGYEGVPFLFPNDICIGPDQAIYMTDSGVHIADFAPDGNIRPDYADLVYEGAVYRIDPLNAVVTRIDSKIKFANGIAFGPDGNLYANETLTGAIFRYEIKSGLMGPRTYFGNVIDPKSAPGWKGPDGMAFGVDGNLYVAVFGQQDITVLGPDGNVVRRLPTRGRLPTNCAFSTAQNDGRLYVTEYEFGAIEVLDVGTHGIALHG